MQPMRFKDCVKLLESHGFTLIRSNSHQVYANWIGADRIGAFKDC